MNALALEFKDLGPGWDVEAHRQLKIGCKGGIGCLVDYGGVSREANCGRK